MPCKGVCVIPGVPGLVFFATRVPATIASRVGDGVPFPAGSAARVALVATNSRVGPVGSLVAEASCIPCEPGAGCCGKLAGAFGSAPAFIGMDCNGAVSMEAVATGVGAAVGAVTGPVVFKPLRPPGKGAGMGAGSGADARADELASRPERAVFAASAVLSIPARTI